MSLLVGYIIATFTNVSIDTIFILEIWFAIRSPTKGRPCMDNRS